MKPLLRGRPVEQSTDAERKSALDRLIDQELLREQMRAADFQPATDEESPSGRWRFANSIRMPTADPRGRLCCTVTG